MLSDYLAAWMFYLCSAGLLLLVCWRVTRGLRQSWRNLWRMLVACLLLTPAPVSASAGLAPAFSMLLIAAVVGDMDSVQRSWHWLGLALLGVLIVALLLERLGRRQAATGRAP